MNRNGLAFAASFGEFQQRSPFSGESLGELLDAASQKVAFLLEPDDP